MIRVILISASLLLIFAPLRVKSERPHVACKLELNSGKLGISEVEEGEPKIPEDCTELEIRAENGTAVNWETVERIPLPNLRRFRLYLTLENASEKKFTWKSISLFGEKPKKIAQLGLDTYLYINGEQVFNYDAPFKYLTIKTIDPNRIIGVFSGQYIQLTGIVIGGNIKLKNIDFTPPEGVTRLGLHNVQIKNFGGFIQKFNSLTDLTVEELGTIDIGDILKSKTITTLDITNTSLTLKDSESHMNENLISLTLKDCTTDATFKENVWKIMPNLTTLWYLAEQDIDFKDILVYKQLTDLTLSNVKLAFTKPTDINVHSLETLKLYNCELDLMKFSEFVSKTFPNLTYLSVVAYGVGGTKPTKRFVNDIMANIPGIKRQGATVRVKESFIDITLAP